LNGALNAIAQQNPARHQAIVQGLQQTGHLARAAMAEQQAQRQAAAQRDQAAFANYAAEQGKAFDQKYGKVSSSDVEATKNYLSSLGLSDSDMAALQTDRTARDHRFQRVLLDAARYHALQQAPAKAIQKPVPPVQKPGTRQIGSPMAINNLQSLNRALDQSGRVEDAVKLMQARRAQQRG
jgi:hypothetical protein